MGTRVFLFWKSFLDMSWTRNHIYFHLLPWVFYSRGQNPRWPPIFKYFLIKLFSNFLCNFWWLERNRNASLHRFSKFSKFWSKTLRVTCPWLNYCFRKWLFFRGFLSTKGKLFCVWMVLLIVKIVVYLL